MNMIGGINYPTKYYNYATFEDAIRRDFGFFKNSNLSQVTLNLIWKKIEPSPATYNDAFLQRIKHFLDLAAEFGLKVNIDFHTLWGSNSKWCIPDFIVDPDTGENDGLALVRDGGASANSYFQMVKHVVGFMQGHASICSWQVLNEPWYYGDIKHPNVQDFVTMNGKAQKERFLDLFVSLHDVVHSLDSRPVTIRFVCSHMADAGNVENHFAEAWNWDSRLFKACDVMSFNAYLPLSTDQLFEKEKTILTDNLTRCHAQGRTVNVTEFGHQATDEEVQRLCYEASIKTYQALNINTASPWLWNSEHFTDNFNICKDIQATPKPAFTTFVSCLEKDNGGAS